MPPRDRDIERVEERLTALERRMEEDATRHRTGLLDVLAAQSKATQDLTSRVTDFQDKVSAVQEDWRTQRATREAWKKIKDAIGWSVAVAAAIAGGLYQLFQYLNNK